MKGSKTFLNSKYIEREKEHWDSVAGEAQQSDSLYDGWLDQYNLNQYDKTSTIIELGCGWGSTTQYLQGLNAKLICCDLSPVAINLIDNLYPHVQNHCFSMTEPFPFIDNYCDCIVADLCLHYFDNTTLDKILNEINRVLKANGRLLCRVNSINDANYGAKCGTEIEEGLYLHGGRYKKFFDSESITKSFTKYKIVNLQETAIHKYGKEKKAFEIVAINTV